MIYNLCDRYNVQIGENTYSCVMFNNEVNVTQGLEEFVYTDMPEESVTDYTKSDKTDRKINIGTVEGDYFFEDNDGEYVQRRKVKWLKHIPRLSFSQGALYEVGSAMSFFSVKNYADEFLSALDKDFKKTITAEDSEDESVGATAEDIVESTKDFILKELSRQLKGYDLEAFVADLLRAMGYRTTVSPQGGDSGIDIPAYKDELPPRILVQVKSQDSDIKETTIQSLKGAMREGDYGLFVTLSNYTKNAQKYLDSTPILRGINGTELVDLVLKYYDLLDDKYKKMLEEQLTFLNNHKADLIKKINHFQNMYRKGHLNDNILSRCCDFILLEEKFKEYSKN